MALPPVSLSAQLLTVALLILKINERHNSIDTKYDQLTDVYDYIVVGSGSAGAVVANRLAENGVTRVLLLEAGGPSSLATDIPSPAAGFTLFNSQYDWNYTNANEWVGQGLVNIPEHRGHVLGGTSSINTMLFNRGHRNTFDVWANKFGAKGWSYDEVLPYFRKYETNYDPLFVTQSPGFHGTEGPVGITSPPNNDPLLAIHQSIITNELGIQNTDVNGPQQLGTTMTQAFIDARGVRSSTANSYIDPNPYPHNLHILTRSLVTRILFEGRKATGVEFALKGGKYTVLAKKEVIICAGVFNSPQLLMLSGIGPKQHLEELGIRVLADLPVGANLQNHAGVDVNFLINQKYLYLVNIAGQLLIDQLYQWLTTGTGPLASHYRSTTYFSTSSNKDKQWPNANFETSLYLFPQNIKLQMRAYQYRDPQAWSEFYADFFEQYNIQIHAILQKTRSRGFVRLASTDPFKAPIISHNYMTHPQDLEDLVEVLSFVFRFYELSSMSQYLIPAKAIPGCSLCPNKRYIYECESYLRCYIQQVLYSNYHSSGTCRMGAVERNDVVVDPNCRVKGISNLRVCDSSIMPLLMNSNTNAGSIMIGEKCADLIKSGH